MARDDWRIRVELPEEGHATALLARLGLDLGSTSRALARELEGHRLPVSRDGNELFVYASSRRQAEQAHSVVESILEEERIEGHASRIEHWLHDEEHWDAEPAEPSADEEALARGYAPWEVRVECRSRAEATELADRLERAGYGVERRFRYVIAGTATKEDARELAKRLHGEVEPGGELVWEVLPQNPFAVFGGLGGTGTPAG
jgi:hypothetical protein